jgi:hypothetical protein
MCESRLGVSLLAYVDFGAFKLLHDTKLRDAKNAPNVLCVFKPLSLYGSALVCSKLTE